MSQSDETKQKPPCPKFVGDDTKRCEACGEYSIVHWIDSKVQEAAVFDGLLKERRWPREVR